MHSKLYREVLNRYFWAEAAEAFTSLHTESGVLGIAGASAPDKAGDLLRVFCDHFSYLSQVPVTQAELSRARNMLKCNVLTQLESRLILFEDIGRQILSYGFRESPEEVILQWSPWHMYSHLALQLNLAIPFSCRCVQGLMRSLRTTLWMWLAELCNPGRLWRLWVQTSRAFLVTRRFCRRCMRCRAAKPLGEDRRGYHTAAPTDLLQTECDSILFHISPHSPLFLSLFSTLVTSQLQRTSAPGIATPG
jgi:hypothetical protein